MRLIRLAERGSVTICASAATIAEFERVLDYQRIQRQLRKLGLSRNEVLVFAVGLITPVITLDLSEAVVAADPQDDVFLACALAAGTPYLVSGDRHLLAIGKWRTIEIITVNEFLARHFPHNP